MTLPRPTQISTNPEVDAAAMFALNSAFDLIEHGDNWHVIGATGQVPFAAGWTSTALTAAFRKTADGTVHIRGQVSKTIAGALGAPDTIFTLPDSYRPRIPRYFITSKSTTPITVAEVAVQGTGNVDYTTNGAAEGLVNVHINISFSV